MFYKCASLLLCRIRKYKAVSCVAIMECFNLVEDAAPEQHSSCLPDHLLRFRHLNLSGVGENYLGVLPQRNRIAFNSLSQIAEESFIVAMFPT